MNGSPGEEPSTTWAFDCVDPMHEEAHFTAESDAVLTDKVLRHFAEYHPDVAEEAVRLRVDNETYREAPEDGDASAPPRTAGPVTIRPATVDR